MKNQNISLGESIVNHHKKIDKEIEITRKENEKLIIEIEELKRKIQQYPDSKKCLSIHNQSIQVNFACVGCDSFSTCVNIKLKTLKR